MKLKSLLLGSIAAAGLSTSAFAADLSVLTSLDVCDALGISGLTISSDTNCLQITGEVKYEFVWGDWKGTSQQISTLGGNYNVADNDDGAAAGTDDNMDWNSKIDAYLKFVGTAESDFGPASATIKFDYDNDTEVHNEVYTKVGSNTLRIEEAFVTIGDTTKLMAGQKGSIFKKDNDKPLTWLNPYNSDKVEHGVETQFIDVADGGPSHVIQLVSDLGDGITVGVGLENLNGVNGSTAAAAKAPWLNATAQDLTADDGTFVGYIAYSGDDISAHVSVIGGGFLDGAVEHWGVHAGFSGTFDNLEFVAAFAADDIGEWNALVSAEGTFDMFTLAAAFEATSGPRGTPTAADQWGANLSVGFEVSDSVTVNAGFQYFDEANGVANMEHWAAALGISVDVTETLTLNGQLGWRGTNEVTALDADIGYASVELAWAPGGGYTNSIKGEIASNGAYKTTFKAKKSFE